MTVTVRMIEPGVIRIEWPGRLTQEVRDTLFWVLDAIDGVDAIWHGNYTTELQTAAHLVDTNLVVALVGNALLDDERLAEFLFGRGWGDLQIRTAP